MMDTSVIHQGNGKLGMYLNIPVQCVSVYDQFIAQLQACRNGEFLGDEKLDHGCLVQVSIINFCKILGAKIQSFNLFQMSLSDEENQCIYDSDGNVRRYEEEAQEFALEQVRNSQRPSRKAIVQFLLDLLEEENDE